MFVMCRYMSFHIHKTLGFGAEGGSSRTCEHSDECITHVPELIGMNTECLALGDHETLVSAELQCTHPSGTHHSPAGVVAVKRTKLSRPQSKPRKRLLCSLTRLEESPSCGVSGCSWHRTLNMAPWRDFQIHSH